MKIFIRLFVSLAVFVGLIGTSSAETEKDVVNNMKDRFQATFTEMKVIDFRESEIPGVYEIANTDQIIYYYPEKELLFFGQMFNKDGTSLTEERLAQLKSNKLDGLNLDDAIVIGNGSKEIVEFTDPDCPYCRKFHEYAKDKDLKRYVFFTPLDQLHPSAHKKAVHVLCSDNKEKAYEDIYENKVGFEAMNDCEKGRDLLKVHRQVSSEFGVQGTPTLAWEGSVVTGFNKERVAQYVNSK